MSTDKAKLNPVELKIELLCLGARVDENCRIEEDGRPIPRSWEELDTGTGLELILPGEIKEIYVNVPVREKFAAGSPYRLVRSSPGFALIDDRSRVTYPVTLAPRPAWMNRTTRGGIPMSRVGMLQGSVLSVTLGERSVPGKEIPLPCSSCSAGKSEEHEEMPSVADVVETAGAARSETGVTLLLLHGRYRHTEESAAIFPYLKALKQEVGILVAVQFPLGFDLRVYDQACELGADHLSFDLDFFRIGSSGGGRQEEAQTSDPESSQPLLLHCVQEMGKGRVSAEIVAGIGPIEETLKTVDFLAGAGVLPLVRVFRAHPGEDAESYPRPRYPEMRVIYRHVFEACRDHHLLIGALPNFNLSVIPHPQDTMYLAANLSEMRAYRDRTDAVHQLMHPYIEKRMRKRETPSRH